MSIDFDLLPVFKTNFHFVTGIAVFRDTTFGDRWESTGLVLIHYSHYGGWTFDLLYFRLFKHLFNKLRGK